MMLKTNKYIFAVFFLLCFFLQCRKTELSEDKLSVVAGTWEVKSSVSQIMKLTFGSPLQKQTITKTNNFYDWEQKIFIQTELEEDLAGIVYQHTYKLSSNNDFWSFYNYEYSRNYNNENCDTLNIITYNIEIEKYGYFILNNCENDSVATLIFVIEDIKVIKSERHKKFDAEQNLITKTLTEAEPLELLDRITNLEKYDIIEITENFLVIEREVDRIFIDRDVHGNSISKSESGLKSLELIRG